jgi:MFS family permease
LFGIEVVELVVYAISVTGVLANAVIAPALPNIRHDLHVSSGGIGLVVALASLPGIVMAPVIGVAADRFGRRQVVIPCLLVFGVGGLIGTIAPTFRVLCLARLLQGFGGAGLVNLAVVILGDRYDGIERTRAIGRNAAVLTASIAVLPLLGGVLTSRWGWHAAFAPFGLAIGMAVIVQRVLPAARPEVPSSLRDQLAAARPYVTDRRAAAMMAAGFVSFMLVFGLVLTALPEYLNARFHAGPSLRGVVIGLPAFGNITTALMIGRLSNRLGTWTMTLLGFGVLGVTFGAIAAAPLLVVVSVFIVLYGVGEGLVIVPLQNYAATLAPTEHRGVLVALWVSAARAGQFLGPVLVGWLMDATSARAPFIVGACVAAVVAVGGGLLRSRLAAPVRGLTTLPD